MPGATTSIAPELTSFIKLLYREAALFAENNFPARYHDMLNAFCNAAQHEGGLRNFYRLCVAVPAALGHNMQGTFYLYNCETRALDKVCDTGTGLLDPPEEAGASLPPSREPYETSDMLVFPLFSRPPRESECAEMPWRHDIDHMTDYCHHLHHPDPFESRLNILGMFSVRPLSRLFHEDRLFFRTLSRWMGYELNKRLLTVQNLRHLCFLNSLGRDIGHNVIIPNMRFRYLLQELKKKIEAADSLRGKIEECTTLPENSHEECGGVGEQFSQLLGDLEKCQHNLIQQHTQISLFLESLFREEHFRYGHLVVKATLCDVEKEIIEPQLELYAHRFEEHGIQVDKPLNMYRQRYPLMVDVGLLSQVYANLFSNAIKYTSEIIDHRGEKRKALAYGCEEVPDFPAKGMKGIKFNVFTTGPPLSEEECAEIFKEGKRGINSKAIKGTGHGLAFIKRVIEAHGGEAGCEPTREGNNFYFILPMAPITEDGMRHQEPGGPPRP